MNEDLLHECFGHCRGDADCRDCDLHDSCRCISDTEGTIDNGLKLVSFEALEGWAEPIAETATDDDESEAPASPELAALSAERARIREQERSLSVRKKELEEEL